MNQAEKKILKDLKDYCLYQYYLMQKDNNFGEMGKMRVLADFARYYLGLSPDHNLSIVDLNRFYLEFKEIELGLKQPDIDLQAVNYKLEDCGSRRRLFFGERQVGFPIILFGPAKIVKKGKHPVYLLEKEEVRSPAATLSIIAFTTADQQVVIRKESIVFDALQKKVADVKRFVEDQIKITAVHEVAHLVFHEKYPDKDLLALGPLVNATFGNSAYAILNEMLADWMPKTFGEEGVLASLCKLAKTDKKRATRIFYQYLDDYNFKGRFDQTHLMPIGRTFYYSVLSYLRKGRKVDFKRLEKDIPRIFNFYLTQFEKLLTQVKNEIENATFTYQNEPVTFEQLAKAQIKAFTEQEKQLDPTSLIYKRYFWENMLIYLKNCAEEQFVGVGELVKKFAVI